MLVFEARAVGRSSPDGFSFRNSCLCFRGVLALFSLFLPHVHCPRTRFPALFVILYQALAIIPKAGIMDILDEVKLILKELSESQKELSESQRATRFTCSTMWQRHISA